MAERRMRFNGRHDSFSSEDELPLKYCLGNRSNGSNSYASLCRREVVGCEFCDQISKSRYQSLIHNAAHIIIPLLNLKVVFCEECRACFTSTTDLQRHSLRAHPPLSRAAELERETRPRVRLKSRLHFEEEPIKPELIDLTDDCTLSLEPVEELAPSLKSGSGLGSAHNNRIGVGPRGWGFKGEPLYVSVHYDELRRPSQVHCRHCKQKFKDRFDLCVHQASHLVVLRRPAPRCSKRMSLARPPTPPGLPLSSERLLRLCDLCCGFLRSHTRRRYVRVGAVSRPGERAPCADCARQFFELNLVARRQTVSAYGARGRRRRLTNDQRLRNIRHRLKAANKLS
ncbi:unnamed protein product, partial [Iphiclides podalirius]